jgi:hypothetical protein
VLPNHTIQDEATIKPWIDPHQLKQHRDTWYKDRDRSSQGILKLSAISFNHTMILLFTDIPALAKPYNRQKGYTGGQKCRRRLPNMSEDVLNVNATRLTIDQPRRHYNQSTPNLKLCPLKLLHLILSLNFWSHRATTPF